jgi:hypothetical protein
VKVFISWSGERSKLVAEALRGWLPGVIQQLSPWLSCVDINKGARWAVEVARELEGSDIGLICMTPENKESPWVLFESGALSLHFAERLVCPLLLELDPRDLRGSPLGQFQATVLSSREDVFDLLKTMNAMLPANSLADGRLQETFDLWWPRLEVRLRDVSTKISSQSRKDTDKAEITGRGAVPLEILGQRVYELSKRLDAMKAQGALVDGLNLSASHIRDDSEVGNRDAEIQGIAVGRLVNAADKLLRDYSIESEIARDLAEVIALLKDERYDIAARIKQLASSSEES